MKFLERLLKLAAALMAIAGAVTAILYFFERRQDRLEDLEAYLMDDDDPEADDEPEKPVELIVADGVYLDQDLDEWDELDEAAAVDLAFLVSPEQVEVFQHGLADAGYSSDYNPETSTLEAYVSGPRDREEIQALDDLLKQLLATTNSTYLGFAFH